MGLSALSKEEAKAIHIIDFHDDRYEDTINYALSRRSLDLLKQLSELGIYGGSSAEVGARFVDRALKGFIQRNMEPPTIRFKKEAQRWST